MPRVDVERIRVSIERAAYAALEKQEPRAESLFVPQDTVAERRRLMATSLLLADTMAPEAHAAVREACEALGVEDRVELFVSPGQGYDTARLALHCAPIGIEFIGGYLDSLDRGGLLAVLGHEIGHSLAHSAHPKFRWALPACTNPSTWTKRAYGLAAELTADRFGLLACGDLDAVLRLEMHGVAGRSAKSVRFDTHAYLAQCKTVAQQIMDSGGVARGTTHPEHYVRGYAEWLFAETAEYKALTGAGPGSRSLDEVDAMLERLVGFPEPSARSFAMAKPAARSDGAAQEEGPASPASNRLEEEGRDTTDRTPRPLDRPTGGVLTEGARRKLAAARDAIASVASAAVPSLRRAAQALGRDVEPSAQPTSQPRDDEGADPLEEERRELIARFEELERRMKKK